MRKLVKTALAALATALLAVPLSSTYAGVVEGEPVANLIMSFDGNTTTSATDTEGTPWFGSLGSGNEIPNTYVVTGNGQGFTVADGVHPWYGLGAKDTFSVALYADISAVDASTMKRSLLAMGNKKGHIALVKTGANTVEVWQGKAKAGDLTLSSDTLNAGFHLFAFGNSSEGSFLMVDGRRVSGSALTTPNDGIQVGALYQGFENNELAWGKALGMVVDEVRGYDTVLDEAACTDLATCFPATAFYARTLSGDGNWNVGAEATDWGEVGCEAPTALADVELNVSEEATLTMNAAATLSTLSISGEGKLTFATDNGEGHVLSSNFTTVNTDVDASSGVASLGAATIATGKTLTVGGTTALSNLTFVDSSACLRIYGETLAASATTVPFGGALTKAGTLVFDCPLSLGTNLAFGSGNGSTPITQNVTVCKSITANRLITGDGKDNVTRVVQEGGDITLTQEDASLTAGETGKYAILFGHWPCTSDYQLKAGSLMAEQGYVHLGWDGGKSGTSVTVSVGQSLEDANGTTALLKVKGFTGNQRDNSATLTVYPSGTLAVGSAGLTVNKASKHVILAGGTLLAYEDLATALTANGLEITASSTVAAATGATLTLDKLVGTSEVSLTIGSSENAGTVVLPTLADFTGAVTVAAGTLVLPAGSEGATTVAEGATLKLKLSGAQLLDGYTAGGVTLQGGGAAKGELVFLDANDEPITEGVDGTTYTPALNTWTPTTAESDGSYVWGNTGNWSKGALPAAADTVRVNLSEDATLTLREAATVGNLRVIGAGTLTLAGAKLTVVGQLVAETGVIASDTTLAAGSMQLAENCEVAYTVAGGELTLPPLTGSGTFQKEGAGTMTLVAANDCEPSLVVNGGMLQFGVENFTKVYDVTAKSGATVQIGTWAGAIASSASSLRLEGGAVLKLNNGNRGAGGSVVAAKIYVSSATDGNPAVIKGNNNGSNGDLTGGIEGVGTLRLESTDDNPFKISGAIKDGEGGTLKVVVATDRGVTFSGSNTYTGGTLVTEGSKLVVAGGSGKSLPDCSCDGSTYSNEVTLEAGATLEWESGQSFAHIVGEGTVKVTGDVIAGLGNNQSGIAVPVIVNGGKTLAIRNWREGDALELPTLTLNGTVRQDSYTGAYAAALTVTGTLSGSGSIEVPLTLAAGATLDATAGAPTVMGALTLPEPLNVTLPEDAATDGTCYLLKCQAGDATEANAAKFAVPAGYTVRPASDGFVLEALAPVNVEAYEVATLQTLCAFARAQGMHDGFTVQVASKGETVADAAKANAALARFTNLGLTADTEENIVTVAYDFGIASLTIRELDGAQYVVLAAKVQGAENTGYAEDTEVAVEMNGTPIEATEMSADPDGATSATGVKWFRIPYDSLDTTGTFYFKVKATKAATP